MRDLLRSIEERDGSGDSVKMGPLVKDAQFLADRIAQFKKQMDRAIQQLEAMGTGGPSRERMDDLREQAQIAGRSAAVFRSIVSTIKMMAVPR